MIFFLAWCWIGWKKIKVHSSAEIKEQTFVTIIIPVRNEEQTIERCLGDLISQQYPLHLFEIIVVNDNSADNTIGKVGDFIRQHQDKISIRLVEIKDQPGTLYKKQAITAAVSLAAGELIITTDADCRRGVQWLSRIVSYYEEFHPEMLCAPVVLDCNNSFFQKIQSLEFCGLISIGAGSIAMKNPILCNGANLAFTKEIFQKVNGFSSDKNSASGDDTQLMRKIAVIAPDKIHFLKSPDAIVHTNAAGSFAELFHQRKRWASKIPVNMSRFTLFVAAIAYLLHLGLVVSLIMTIAGVIPFYFFLIPFLVKVTGELLLLNSSTRFLGKQKQLWLLLPAEVFYLFYIVIIGTLAPFGSYQWKGRRVK
jgi:cellulose synthase/poly-beta-1,6-N-acetylglucosamine synthase-like glycosyltransferase